MSMFNVFIDIMYFHTGIVYDVIRGHFDHDQQKPYTSMSYNIVIITVYIL